jgi:hypothetical protein
LIIHLPHLQAQLQPLSLPSAGCEEVLTASRIGASHLKRREEMVELPLELHALVVFWYE